MSDIDYGRMPPTTAHSRALRHSSIGRFPFRKRLGSRKLTAVMALLLFAAGGWETGVAAQSMDKWLLRLDPEERARQACMLRGLNDVRRDPRLRTADRMKSSILSRAAIDATHHIVAKGGAVRMRGKWYALSFDCHLTPDHMRAKDFSFTLGAPIPKSKWQDLGLW
ncbi:MAG: DUF930 domain-containing protein [Hyphomicrobiaceae bacterium]